MAVTKTKKKRRTARPVTVNAKAPRTARRAQKKGGASYSAVEHARNVDPRVALFLFTQAGGRCEFDNCNRYLLEHEPTFTPGNFAEKAHIYAFKVGGPRGASPGRPKDINSLGNLMLLCPICHKLIDRERPQDFPVEVLRKFKEEHEARVRMLTGIAKDRDTVPIIVKGLIGDRPFDISDEEMQAAVAPNYIRRDDKIVMNLTALPDRAHPSYWDSARTVIDQQIDRLARMPVKPGRTMRVSVFGIAAIPLLMYVGSRLTDKQTVDLYQRQRAPESWVWKEEIPKARFLSQRVRSGNGDVALLVNVSGTNTADMVAQQLNDPAVYDLAVTSEAPNLQVMRTRADLDAFTAEYLQVLSKIRTEHPHLQRLHVFPAVPPPAAVVLGRSRLPKVDASQLIYDRDQRTSGVVFVPTIELKRETA